MSYKEIKDLVLQVATEKARSGPGWAQEGVVLREVSERISGGKGRPDLQVQRDILNAWHDLFMEKLLAWGYDLDNPNSPFFHVREAA